MKKSFTQRALHSLVCGTLFGLSLMTTAVIFAYAQGNAQPVFQSMLEGMLVNPNPATTDWQVVNARDADHALIADSVDLAPMKILNGNVGISIDQPSEKLDIAGNLKLSGNIIGKEYQYRADGKDVVSSSKIEQCKSITVTGDSNSKFGYGVIDLAMCTTDAGCDVHLTTQHIRDYRGNGVKTLDGSLYIGPTWGNERHAMFRFDGAEHTFWLGDSNRHSNDYWGWTWLADFSRKGANLDSWDQPLTSNTSFSILSHPHTKATWTFCGLQQ